MSIIKIYVATHKKAKMPANSIYIPVQSGSAIYPDIGYVRDDTGDNISIKNSACNNLCPLYWSWKNSDADIIGAVHYRRFLLGSKKTKDKWESVIDQDEIISLLNNYDVLLPKKSRYFFMSTKTHYVTSIKGLKSIHANDIKTLTNVIADKYPDYLTSCKKVLNRKWAHMATISIMSKEKFAEYCSFMFDVLFECEKRLQGKRHDYNRYIGALSEFVIDIWIDKNNYTYKELDVFMPEKPSFFKRFASVFNRMFFGKKEKNRYNAEEFEKNKIDK